MTSIQSRSQGEPTRKMGHLSPERYLALWHELENRGSLRLADTPAASLAGADDEFRITFNFRTANRTHEFERRGHEKAFGEAEELERTVTFETLLKEHEEDAEL